MYDAAYFREHAQRYRRLARTFRDQVLAERFEALAEDLEEKARQLLGATGGYTHAETNPVN